MPVDAAAFRDTYRVKCPRGHANLVERRQSRTAYCKGCRDSYSWDDLVDTKNRAAEK